MSRPGDNVSRFVTRQWQRRLHHLRPLLAVLLGVAAVGFGVWVVFVSTWLAVERLEVAGTTAVPGDAVVAAADVDTGTPLAAVDIDEVHDAVARIPAVANVTVHRSWPHTITITVTEREPVATISRANGWWLFDKEGVLYGRSARQDPTLAVVTFDGDPDRTALHEVASVVVALPVEVRDDVRQIEASSMDSIQLNLLGGRTVVWGSAAESERKVQVLALLLSRRAAVYDLSVPEQPTTSRP